MIIKEYCHYAIVHNYFFAKGKERTIYNNDRHVFYIGDTLYSYGTHFPLAVKCNKGWILNGDRYSNSTSIHQSIVRETARRHQPGTTNTPLLHCIIPFSSLRAAQVKPEDITILDVSDDTYETVQRKDPTTREIKEYKIHHLGASLIRVKTKRYLSSIDNGSKRHTFFLVELRSHQVNTIKEAFRDLAGKLSEEQYRGYLLGEIERQGEYFLEPHPEVATKELIKKAKKQTINVKEALKVLVKTPVTKRMIRDVISRQNMGYGGCSKEQIQVIRRDGVPYYVLLDRNSHITKIPDDAMVQGNQLVLKERMVKQFDLSYGIGNPHIATHALQTTDGVYITGTLRHREHRMISLGNTWYKVYKNTAMGSWSAIGNVD